MAARTPATQPTAIPVPITGLENKATAHAATTATAPTTIQNTDLEDALGVARRLVLALVLVLVLALVVVVVGLGRKRDDILLLSGKTSA